MFLIHELDKKVFEVTLLSKNKVKTQLLKIKLNDKTNFADYSSENI